MAYLTDCHCPKCGKNYNGVSNINESKIKLCNTCRVLQDDDDFNEFKKQFIDNTYQLKVDVLLRYLYDLEKETDKRLYDLDGKLCLL